jgi:thioredoxin 1
MIHHLTKTNLDDVVTHATKPVIIDVYATWCGPCQQVKPIFESLAKELCDSYVFAELNVDEARELAVTYGVTSVPSFIFIQDGVVKGKALGYMPKEVLKKKITELLG